MYISIPGHMTKMSAMPIYGKIPSKIFFSGTGGPISTKLGMERQKCAASIGNLPRNRVADGCPDMTLPVDRDRSAQIQTDKQKSFTVIFTYKN